MVKNMKTYYQLFNVGTAKYVVNFHNGTKKHKDGSRFYDIKIFRNKKKLKEFITNLENLGYTYQLP